MQHSRQDDPTVIAGLLPDGYVEVRAGARQSTVEGNAWYLVYGHDELVPQSVSAIRADGTARTVAAPGF